jgi:pantoate kinase
VKTFFVPGHITGFFEIRNHEDYLKTGSRGGGIVMNAGVDTGAIVRDSEKSKVNIFFEGKECKCTTTNSVVKEMLKYTCGSYSIEIHHFPKLPSKYGFGVSGAGSLGTAFALNYELDLGFDDKRLGEIAHIAEVKNNTGMGDVSAELSGGLVVRKKEGAPSRGKIISFPIETYVVAFIIGKPLLTKSVLKNNAKIDVINSVGRACLDSFLRRPSPQQFMELSRKFTLETGLAQKKVLIAIKTLEKKGVTAAMCMLGNSLFTVSDDPEKIQSLLNYRSIVSTPFKKR